MSKVCNSCGNVLKDNAKFCPKCGTPVGELQSSSNNIIDSQVKSTADTLSNEQVNTQSNTDIAKTSSNTKKKVFKVLKISGIVIILFFLIIFGLALKEVISERNAAKNTASTSTQQDMKPTSVETVLANFNMKGKIISSTYAEKADGFIINLDNRVYVADLKNNQFARVENYSYIVRNIQKMRGRDNSSGSIILQFLIFNDKHGKDEQMGEWRGSNHFLPVFVRLEFDGAGNVKSRGVMSSGLGAATSHYQGDLQEQKNIDLVNIFLKDLITFIENPQNEAVNQGSFANVSNSSSVHYGTINANEVNVRKGPGKEFKSLGFFFKGDKVRLVGETSSNIGENWYQIEYDNPNAGLIKGWVRKDFIDTSVK